MTIAIKDFLRNDQRVDIMPQPLWYSTKDIKYSDIKNNNLISLMFKPGMYQVHSVALEVISAITGTSGIDIGLAAVPDIRTAGTQATYDATTLSNAAAITVDIATQIFNDADVVSGTVNSSTHVFSAGTVTPLTIISTTDNVCLTVKENDLNTATAGEFRVHALISRVPTATF